MLRRALNVLLIIHFVTRDDTIDQSIFKRSFSCHEVIAIRIF